jgi:hypothetical protein
MHVYRPDTVPLQQRKFTFVLGSLWSEESSGTGILPSPPTRVTVSAMQPKVFPPPPTPSYIPFVEDISPRRTVTVWSA